MLPSQVAPGALSCMVWAVCLNPLSNSWSSMSCQAACLTRPLLLMQELAEKKAELEALETGGNVRGGASQDTRSVDELLHFIGAVEGSHSQGKVPGKGKKKKAKKKKGPSMSPPSTCLAWWPKAAQLLPWPLNADGGSWERILGLRACEPEGCGHDQPCSQQHYGDRHALQPHHALCGAGAANIKPCTACPPQRR